MTETFPEPMEPCILAFVGLKSGLVEYPNFMTPCHGGTGNEDVFLSIELEHDAIQAHIPLDSVLHWSLGRAGTGQKRLEVDFNGIAGNCRAAAPPCMSAITCLSRSKSGESRRSSSALGSIGSPRRAGVLGMWSIHSPVMSRVPTPPHADLEDLARLEPVQRLRLACHIGEPRAAMTICRKWSGLGAKT